MSDSFDAYHVWLGIPPEEQPPDCYRLLGIPLFEERPEVIEHAADQRMAHLKSVGAGKHTAWAQRLLNEVAGARVRLLDPYKRAMYDRRLREELGEREEGRGAREEGRVGQASLPAKGGQAFLPVDAGVRGQGTGRGGRTRTRLGFRVRGSEIGRNGLGIWGWGLTPSPNAVNDFTVANWACRGG